MTIKEKIDQDIKQAMLAGDKDKTTTLRGLKSAILYVEVAKGSRDQGLSDPEIIEVLQKEAKKRQESADLYSQGGNSSRASAELTEKALIETYLPTQLSDSELNEIIDRALQQTDAKGLQQLGQVIGVVKQAAGGRADGATIARLVKAKLIK